MEKMTTPTQPQQQPVFAPPEFAPSRPQSSGRSRKGLILGAIAAVGLLGFIAMLAAGAVILFFVVGSTSGGDASADRPADAQPVGHPAEDRPSNDRPAVDEQPVAEPPEGGGSLDGIVQDQVGGFALQQDGAIPEVTDAGAIDAQHLLYASSDGVEIVHQLAEWGSADMADQMLQAQNELYASDGYQQVGEFEVTGQDGEQIGSGVALAGSDGEEVILWTDDVVSCVVIAPEGYGIDFYGDLPY